MLYIVIAVFIVLIIMNVFMLLVLRQVTASTGKQIEKDAVRLFSAYDKLLEDRSQMLEELDEEIAYLMEELENQAPVPALSTENAALGAATLVTGRYRDKSFTDVYHKVKSRFQMDMDQVVEQLQKQSRSMENQEKVQCMKGIMDKFSFDAQYEISVLTVSDQKTLLEAVLDPEEQKLYAEFQEKFTAADLQSFLQWLRLECKNLDTELTLRVADSCKRTDSSGPVNIEYTPDLCEGFVVMQGNKLYDYSI